MDDDKGVIGANGGGPVVANSSGDEKTDRLKLPPDIALLFVVVELDGLSLISCE